MARKLKSDKVLFLATLLLVLASVVMVYSASAAMAEFKFGNPYLFLVKQGMWATLGIAIMSIVMRVDYRVWRQPMLIWTALGFAFLALVAVLFSAPINGTRRWFGLAGFGIQPSEIAKLAVIFFTAALLERRMSQVNDLKETLVAARHGRRRPDRADPARAGLRHVGVPGGHRRPDAVCGRIEPALRRRGGRHRAWRRASRSSSSRPTA